MGKRMSHQANNDRQTTRARVFISYKHVDDDQKLAMKIYEALRQRFDVFIDRDILAGAHWAARINKELERTDFFIVLLSKQSIQSEMVIGELEVVRDLAAERAEKRPQILPVRVAYRDRLPYPLSAYFHYVQWIDWREEDDTPGVVEQLMQSMTSGREDDRVGWGLPVLPGVSIPIDWSPPRGALSPESHYYIERASESKLCRLIGGRGVTISICGPRQIGKTSLLARIAKTAHDQGKRVVDIDFQLFEKSAFKDARTFYQQLCGYISVKLKIEPVVEKLWDNAIGNGHNLDQYIQEYVLPEIQKKAKEAGRDAQAIVLAMDEVERVFDAPFCSEFFSILRSWHDGRAKKDSLRQLDMVLVASTEPNLWIPALNHSPFNVGERTNLGDFTEENVQELNRRYGSPLNDEQLRRLIDLVSGHPYLVHYAIYSISNNNYDAEHLFKRALSDDGPFADHLNHLLFKLYGKPELTKAMRRIIHRATCRDENIYDWLHGAGLVRRDDDDNPRHVLPSRRLYAAYFHARLKPTLFWQSW
jgi:hypothetical protein